MDDELRVTEQLLSEANRVIDAIPECPAHGRCIPHALDWIEKQRQRQRRLERIDCLYAGAVARAVKAEAHMRQMRHEYNTSIFVLVVLVGMLALVVVL